MNRQPRLMLDMDGVLADWLTGVFERARLLDHHRDLYLNPLPTPSQITCWELTDQLTINQAKLVEQAKVHPILYSILRPMPGAVEAVAGLRDAGIQVGVLTSPDLDNPACASAKLEWLERHFDRALAESAVITKDKTQVMCDVLVDDKPDITGRYVPTWTQVLFDQPYNRHCVLPRLNSWDDWHTLLPLLHERSAA